ncbi:hypothetical protein EG349_16560 [Chryseobacterium shandongense]|uniref:Uncharacterized protein n=1 Tax=Chryseobacterium shandongense TaxID=1493872 RepID=A0A3G6QW40_9FLAO|nr:hypothetical protein EG349_14510 [Chryseobacterium shandongense]AZA88272.1 hypothetical protein EG349_16560 [Chryseobacterium shandongense]AZA96486.1 hypothetical protein EG353_13290 [Chryseobacterium shandongense]AZA96834.1 hypothetical protein EG353_15350 [Chryseobacterium shandongense]
MQSGKTGRRRGVDRMGDEGLRLLKKTLKFSSETFGQIKNNFYFCTRKYGAELTERSFVTKRKI